MSSQVFNSTNSSSEGPNSEMGQASGVNLGPSSRSLSEWERGSSSSLSEFVACLQDRIMQMEEKHHSTCEELQATLQELTDLQNQLTDLHLDNERLADEKAVFLESLCSQTEKLEECLTQISQLMQLLFQQGTIPTSERESNLVDLLKRAQEAHDVFLMKQEGLFLALQVAKNDCRPQTNILLRDRVRLLESTIESTQADQRLVESHLSDAREQLAVNHIEISQLKSQLENEQQKVEEWNKFQADLLTTVRVANDFKTEAMQDVERLKLVKKELSTKIDNLETQNTALKSQMQDYQREVEELSLSNEDLTSQAKEAEKKQKFLETELIQLREDLSSCEQSRKTAEAKRDKLHEGINNNASKRSLLIDEERRLEARIQQLEEEQGNSEALLDKARKSQTQIEQLIAELASEKATSQMLESNRIILERQNKELKLNLQKMEISQIEKSKTAINLESKLGQLEEQLEEETREKLSIVKSSRKLKKRVKELHLQLDDEQRQADQYKEQLEKINSRMKNLKRQLDESEEECSREQTAKRKVQRKLEDLHENCDDLQREVTNLKNKTRSCGSCSASRLAT